MRYGLSEADPYLRDDPLPCIFFSRHDYYFIQTFVTDHIKYHAGYLHATTQ